MNKKIIAISFLIAMLFVGAIAGTTFYYNGIVNDRNSKIVNLNNEIANLTSQVANLNSQVSNLNDQVTNLTSAHLVTALGITEILYSNTNILPSPQPYNHLYISGSVNNTGRSIAYSAGLRVVAYFSAGTLEINLTVPLVNGAVFGTDAGTNAYVSSNYGISSLQLGLLYGGQTANISLAIYHEGLVSNWTVTPVWTNTPNSIQNLLISKDEAAIIAMPYINKYLEENNLTVANTGWSATLESVRTTFSGTYLRDFWIIGVGFSSTNGYDVAIWADNGEINFQQAVGVY